MSLIQIKNIEKIYDIGQDSETVVLRGVDFEISEGEFVAVMGPSGSGKSTLLHILGLLDRQTKGKFIFDSKDTSDYSDEELALLRNKKIGFVFQSFNLLPRTSVLENVALPLVYAGVDEEKRNRASEEAIKSVGLGHRIYHEPSQLSGGEKQRVAIARALVNNPKVIFADEPTGNLDSKSGEMVMDLFQKLHDKGHTIVLITHETYTAEHAERIIKLRDGNVESDSKVSNRRRSFQK